MTLIDVRQASINKLARGKRFLLAIPFLMRLLNYVLPAASAGQAFRRDERISVEIKTRDRSRIGDSAPQYCGATKRSAERHRRR